jgi:hypothetical protein
MTEFRHSGKIHRHQERHDRIWPAHYLSFLTSEVAITNVFSITTKLRMCGIKNQVKKG